jgi:hypothetical protein
VIWPVWVVQAIWFVATTIISIALAPRPPKAKAASLEDFTVPTAEEGRSIPVIFGTVRITGPNVVWYGDLDKKPIKKKSLFGSSQTTGYKYYLGLHYVLSFGPIDEFMAWEWDDKIAWSGSRSTSGTESIDLPKLFGGKNGEGGLVGFFDLDMGEQTQSPNAYLLANIGAPLSAYRGVTSVVWKGGYVGKSQYLKPVSFTVRRTAAGWEGGTCWNPADVTVDGGMNPAHIVYEVLTNSNFGYGEPGASIDEVSFGAAADQFVTENFGLNIQWVNTDELEGFLGEVCSHAGMVLGEDPTTGKYTLTLLRDNYVAADLDLIDEDTVIEMVRYSRQGWGETVNEINVFYTDPDSFKSTGVPVHDLGNIRSQGRVISQAVQFPGIRNAGVAQTVAARELAQRSTPLGRGTIRCSRRAWKYQQGHVFRFSWEKEGLVDVVHRVMAIRKGTLEDGSIEIDIAEDIFGLATSVYTAATSVDAIPTRPDTPDEENSTGGTVLSATTTAPPGSPADGDTYYVPTGATGAWAGHAGEVATWDEEESEWVFETVDGAPVVYVADGGGSYQTFDGAGGTTPAPWDLAIRLLAWKAPVRVATTANGTLASAFENGDTVDGVTLATGDRILLKDQSTASQNGIYVVKASGAPSRATDADSSAEILGATVFVSEGTANGNKQFSCTTDAPITLGSTSLVFAQISGGTGGGLSDGDYGDIVVSGGGTALNFDSSVVTAAARTVLDDTTTSAMRTTLGLGTVATLASDTDTTLAANSNSNVPTQAAVKSYIDNLVAGISWKQAVRAATTVAGTLASSFENGDTVDGVTLATGDRILLKDQASASENGIYTVNASGAPTRALDANTGAELVNATVYVSEGTTLADTQWTCSTNATITVGSTSIAFAQLTSGSGAISALTGDVTATGPGSAAATIANDAVTNAKLANMVANAIKARKTGSTGDPEDCTLSELLDFIGSAAQGDILYRGASSWARLAAGSTAGHVLQTSGAGGNPLWGSVGAAAGGTYGVYANANQSKASDAVLADDAALVTTLTASKKYRIEIYVQTDTNATADAKWDLNFTGTTTSMFWVWLHSTMTTSSLAAGAVGSTVLIVSGDALNTSQAVANTGTQTNVAQITVQIEVGASGGTFSYRWAQNTSNAGATVRRRNSSLLVTEIS